jgi:hypothetical protein
MKWSVFSACGSGGHPDSYRDRTDALPRAEGYERGTK